MLRTLGILCILGCTFSAFGAGAVVIDSGDGVGNTTPPGDDPGWAHVGTQDFKSVVYVGNGWVMTAVHVGVGDVEIGGVVYPAVADSRVVFTNDDKTAADLMVFRIEGDPGLPVLPISRTTPRIGADVVLVGHGRDRGTFLSWNPSPSLDTAGWNLLGSRTLRWGTNKIESTPSSVVVGNKTTTSIYTRFSAPGEGSYTTHEAQASTGDSGGAAFVRNEQGRWELAGIIYAVQPFIFQPSNTAMYGNLTYLADLATYRKQIIETVRPACSDEIDNDDDGWVDFPVDGGCTSTSDGSELAACRDGLDNDGDGHIDYPDDLGCAGPDGRSESFVCVDPIDTEGDGIPDACDNCPDAVNGDQLDADADGIGDACEIPGDDDGDAVVDLFDNCPLVPNGPDQRQLEGVGNQLDRDGDFVGDACDICITVPNPRLGELGLAPPLEFQNTTGGQLDDDGDGIGNACDGDFDQSGAFVVGIPDLIHMRHALGRRRESSECLDTNGRVGGPCAKFDLDGNLPIIGLPDLNVFRVQLGRPPGPSALVPLCGDGFRAPSEACDDGNLVSGDGCSPGCVPEP